MASKKTNERQKIPVYVDIDLSGGIQMVSKVIQDAIATYGPDAMISYDSDYDDYDGGCYNLRSVVYYQRDETDKEMNDRIAKVEKTKEKARIAKLKKADKLKEKLAKEREIELAIYEALKKKYEGA